MKVMTIIQAKTHADFLTQLLKRPFKGFMRNIYTYTPDLDIWFNRLDGIVTKYGWKNYVVNEGTIIEEFVGDPKGRLISHEDMPTKNRAIYKFDDYDVTRIYKFMGIFEVNGNSNKRIWTKILDGYEFKL